MVHAPHHGVHVLGKLAFAMPAYVHMPFVIGQEMRHRHARADTQFRKDIVYENMAQGRIFVKRV